MSHFSSRTIRLIFAPLTVLLVALALAAPAFAATEMTVVASAPAADETAAPASGRYWVQFANNVAAVKGNAKCVSLRTVDGADVPKSKYKVSLPDTELEFGYRQFVWVDAKGLDEGASYVIHVSGDITAKNGNKLGEDVDIPFAVTASGSEASSLAEPAQVEGGSGSGDGTGSGGSSSASSSSSGEQGSGDAEVVDLTPKTEAGAQEEPVPVQVIVLFAVMIAAVIVALALKTRRSSRK